MNNTCKKTTFQTDRDAFIRKNQINNENILKFGKKNAKKLRIYKCKYCGLFHLTSMAKGKYKYYNNSQYKSKIDSERFLKIESDFWENKLN